MFGSEDRFRSLRVGANDDRFSDRFEAPAGGDALNLAGGIFAVAAGADQYRVGAPDDAIQNGVISAIEEVFHHAGHHGEIFRRSEDIGIEFDQLSGAGFSGMNELNIHIRFTLSAFGSGLRHLMSTAGFGVKED